MFVCGEPRRFVLDPSIQASPMNRDYLTFRIPFSLVAGTMSYVMPGITEHCIPSYLLKLLRIYFLFLLSLTSFFHPYHCFFNDTPNCFFHVIPLLDIEELYAFVECYDVLQDAEQMATGGEKPEGFEHKYGFQLVSPMPRTVYEVEAGGSIRDKIGRGGNLLVETIDDDDNESDAGEGA